jgi:exodeoxyribonuclease V alpha subunit
VELVLEIERVRWRAPDGAFAVVDGVTDDGEEVCVTGALGHVHEGETVAVGGAWREHERFGLQFCAEAVSLREPVSEAALLGVLGAVKHVGRRGAEWLLDRHGADVLEVVDASPRARLREVPGIGRARLDAAVTSWQEARSLRAVRMFLDAHGVPAAAAARVTAALGPGAVEVLTEDPYALCDVDGVGFRTADAVAEALGLAADAPARLRAGVLFALREAETDGHCLLPRGELEDRARRLLGTDVADAVDELASLGKVVVEEDSLLAQPEDGAGPLLPSGPLVAGALLHRIESMLGRHVRRLLDGGPALELDGPPERPVRGVFVPTDVQWAAVTGALEQPLSILTGGPGTGKTTVMRTLVDVAKPAKLRVRLCAPTGKAARRLAESTGAEATTIHRLLEWVPGDGPARGPGDPIAADVLVVDEASMLDVRLAEALFAAVGDRTHVLLVGDPDQLAPVGPGRVLADLLACGRVPTTELTEIFRQAARSLIVRAAHAINHGEHPPRHGATGADGAAAERDFYLVAREDPAAILEEIVSLASRRLPAHLELDPRADVQVLAPMHKGPVGVDALNTELRAVLNPEGEPVPGGGLRVGDRVLQTVNDHEHNLMNGETGVLVDFDPDRARVVLAADDGRRLALPTGALGTVRLGYAASVHKAQGSQWPAVVVPLFRGHSHMLTRNLLYTAVSRGSRMVVLVGQPSALGLALSRVDGHRRHTRLAALAALEA